jgi:elongation factor Ts
MMDCKKALVENNCVFDEAVDWLRKKGLAAAAKKASRIASDGIIVTAPGVYTNHAIIMEVNSETDFTANNEEFRSFVLNAANVALASGCESVAALLEERYLSTPLREVLASLIASTGENIAIRRLDRMTVERGVISEYMHNGAGQCFGKIGVLVALETDRDVSKSAVAAERLYAFGRNIAKQIAATNPRYISAADVPPEVIAHEKDILMAQLTESNKPPEVIGKMIDGRLRKFLEEVVLEEQISVIEDKRKIGDLVREYIPTLSADLGENVTFLRIVSFVRFVLGEGLDKSDANFAEDVMSLLS